VEMGPGIGLSPVRPNRSYTITTMQLVPGCAISRNLAWPDRIPAVIDDVG